MTLPSGITNGYSAKENDGRGHRKRLLCRIVVWLFLSIAFFRLCSKFWIAEVNVSDTEIVEDTVIETKKFKTSSERSKSSDSEEEEDASDPLFRALMEGELTLINIKIPEEGLRSTKTEKYSGVKASFCRLKWRMQARDPSKVPMFKDIMKHSDRCSETVYWADLFDITRKAKEYDLRNEKNDGPTAWEPTAFVFHETRCGSTLIANLLAAFDPSRTRVYSEATPIATAANKGCHNGCDPGAQTALIQDVLYMMGRMKRRKSPQYVFYKFGAPGALSIRAVAKAMSNTPWIYVYRDPIEVMMSHFKNYQKGNPLDEDFYPVCIRQLKEETQHPLLETFVESKGRTIESLSKEEYCAAYLAALCESAISGHKHAESDTKHWFINYNELPNKIWDTVLPALVPPLTADQLERMEEMSNAYSKGRGKRAGEWHDDSKLKQKKAPDSVKEAAAIFLQPSYEKLETIRESMQNKLL